MASFVIESTLPGVTVLVNTAQVARPIKRQPTSTAFIIGYSPWGPVNAPRVVTSFQDFARQFGGFDLNSMIDDFSYIFFNLFPGKQEWVCRVVGPAAAKATKSLNDRAGTPVPTIRVDAKYPSSRVDIRVTVEAGTQANTVKFTFRSIFLNRKEVFDNFKVDVASITDVNQRSKLVDLTNLNSATAAPNNLPALAAESSLTGGTDDFAGITAATYIGTDNGTTKTGLQVFKDEIFGTGQVAIPGITTDTAHAAINAHCEIYHRLGLLDPPFGSDKQDLLDIRSLYGTWYGALYWPWVEYLDFEGTGLRKFYPPSAFAAGACAKADVEFGTHKAPANFQIPGALGVELSSNGQSQTDENTRELLNGRDINVITPLPEQGVKVYGARVITGDRRVQMVHEIRLLNLFYYSAQIGYQWAPFLTVDPQGRLFRDLVASGQAFLRPFYQSGALFGKNENEAFIVVADESNNPKEELDNQRVHVQWGVKISPTAEIVIIHIDNVRLFQDLSVLQQ
jgi:phage tail sheath protein FI